MPSDPSTSWPSSLPLSLHRRVQELLLGFSRGISATLSCWRSARGALLGAQRPLRHTARIDLASLPARTRAALRGSSDRAYAAAGTACRPSRTPSRARSAARCPAVLAAHPGRDGRILVAPLRGWRRALGTLVVEGDPRGLDDATVRRRIYDFGRQFSFALENVQLLEEVLRQRRLLEDTFNSLVDLVVVTDNALRIVQTNDAFAARVGSSRRAVDRLDRCRELVERGDRPVGGCAGDAGRPPDSTQDPCRRHGRGPPDHGRTLGGIFAATVTPLINHEGESHRPRPRGAGHHGRRSGSKPSAKRCAGGSRSRRSWRRSGSSSPASRTR